MGLTIHYGLQAGRRSRDEARQLVEQLRQRALDLPLKRVDEVVEFEGPEALARNGCSDSGHYWLVIQASAWHVDGETYHEVVPTHLIGFSTWPGDGCEAANFGLCLYPAQIAAHDDPSRRLETDLAGWSWNSFCKTQYASDPRYGGMENFVRCHGSVVRLLDSANDLGFLGRVQDDSRFWETRDEVSLRTTVGKWNAMIAAAVGTAKDLFSTPVQAPITRFPNFEHLEAKGRRHKKEG